MDGEERMEGERRLVRSVLGICASLSLVSGCNDGTSHTSPAFSEPRSVASRVDSAGIEIVESASPWWRDGEEWRVASEPDLVLGSLEGAGGTDFVRVRDILVLPDGGLLVADDGTDELRSFAPDGTNPRLWARFGDGPGEVQSPRMLRRLAGDSIALFDWGSARVSIFSPELDFVREIPIRTRIPGITMPHVKAITPSGEVLLMGAKPPWVEDAVPNYGQPQHVLIQDDDGVFDVEILRTPGKGFYDVHYGTLGERFLVVEGGAMTIREFALDGTPTRRMSHAHRPSPIPPEFFEEPVDPRGSSKPTTLVGADGSTITTRPRRRDPSRYPETLPAADRLKVDGADHVWVRHGRWPLEGAATWSVFRPDGQWLGEVETPDGVEVHHIARHHLVGTMHDELGVLYVVRYPILGR